MSSSEWKETRLGDIATIIDCPHSTPKWTDSGYFVVRNWNIRNGRLAFDRASYTDEETFWERIRRGKPEFGDLVLTREAPMGEVCMIPQNIECCLGQRVVLIKPEKEEIDSEFLLYSIQSPFVQNQINLHDGTGSTVSNLRIPAIHDLNIPLPPRSTQKRIASILSALDEKIELNRQTNATLEAIAQAIFREWFVNFNYPVSHYDLDDYMRTMRVDGENHSESGNQTNHSKDMVEGKLGLMPAGWRVGTLGEVCEFVKGVSYKSSELQPSTQALVTLKSINRGGGFNFDGFKEYTGKYKDAQVLNEGDLVIAQTDITQNADVVGCPAIVQNLLGYEKLIASLDLIICRPSTPVISSEVLFYFLKHQAFKDYCLSHTNGSTVLHLRSSEISNYQLVIPSTQTLAQFNSIVQSIRLSIANNHRQNQLLAQIRDTLLPKLMRGEIVL